MDCQTCRESLSARLDGETEPSAEVDEHLRTCGACAGWLRQAEELNRSLRVRPAMNTPDLSAAILAASPAPLPRRDWWARGALLIVAVAQLGLGLSQVLGVGTTAAHLGHGGPAVANHLFNESTAWNLALGVGMLWAVFRVRATAGLIPVCAGFVAVLGAYSAHDLIAGAVPVSRLVGHGLVIAGLCLMIVVNRQQHRPDPDDVEQSGGEAGKPRAGSSRPARRRSAA